MIVAGLNRVSALSFQCLDTVGSARKSAIAAAAVRNHSNGFHEHIMSEAAIFFASAKGKMCALVLDGLVKQTYFVEWPIW